MTHSPRPPAPNPIFRPTVYMLGIYVPQELLSQDAMPIASPADDRTNGPDSNWVGLAIVGLLMLLSGVAFTYGATQFSEAWVAGIENLMGQQESDRRPLF